MMGIGEQPCSHTMFMISFFDVAYLIYNWSFAHGSVWVFASFSDGERVSGYRVS